MSLRVWRFIVLVLAALTVGMKFAHLLELFPKLQWDAELYVQVQTSLYQVFGTLGPVIDVGAVLSAFALAYWVHRLPGFKLTVVGAGAMVLSLVVWLVVVAPASMNINTWAATNIPADWMVWRNQWQFGQVGSFALDVTGFCLLLASVLRETTTSSKDSE